MCRLLIEEENEVPVIFTLADESKRVRKCWFQTLRLPTIWHELDGEKSGVFSSILFMYKVVINTQEFKGENLLSVFMHLFSVKA